MFGFLRRLSMALMMLVVLQALGVAQGGKGLIKGTVTDKKSHEPLIGANVVIKGTYYGAVSDPDGKFVVRNINPGSYTLEVSLLGYKKMQYTDYKVAADQTLTLDVQLEETILSLGQEVVVIGQKPLFDLEETQSTHTISNKETKFVATQSVQNIVSLQTGVVQADDEVHIRGERDELAWIERNRSADKLLAFAGRWNRPFRIQPKFSLIQ